MKRRQFLSHGALWSLSPANLALAAPSVPILPNRSFDKLNL
ncbi:MAG: hypothetical protein ACKOF9_06020 [Burkholderiales bacterium]